MNRRERITFWSVLVLLFAVVLVGFPAGKRDTGVFSVHADATSPTPNPAPSSGAAISVTPATSPTVSPSVTVTPTVTATPTITVSPTVTPTPNPNATSTPTPTPTPEIIVPHIFKSVSAYYTGSAVVVGDEIDYDALQVYAIYEDGTSERVERERYILSDTIVREQGLNKFVAIYNGSTETFYVRGKKLDTVTVTTDKLFYGYYNSFDPSSATILAFYNDGSIEEVTSGYSVTPAAFTTSGSQNVTVSYRGKEQTFTVYVYAKRAIKTLSVDFLGDSLVQDEKIKREDLKVMAVYDDGSYSTERINNYDLSQTSFTSVGENILAVSFLGATATCKINVKAKQIVSMSAKYTGEPIEVGSIFSEKDIHVYLKYNDNSEVEIKDYNIYDSIIRYLGDNTIKIYYGDFMTSVKIEGIEELPVDFTYVSEFSIRSGENPFTITTALPRKLTQEDIKGKLVKKTKMTKAFRRLQSKTGWYCGFYYDFSEFAYEAYLPVTIRLTLPDDMEPEYTEVYYTPDLKNIVATMNKQRFDDHTLEITIFRTGAYMIVYDPAAYVEEPEEEDEATEEEDSTMEE